MVQLSLVLDARRDARARHHEPVAELGPGEGLLQRLDDGVGRVGLPAGVEVGLPRVCI